MMQSSFRRREFLKVTGAAAAGSLGAPFGVSARPDDKSAGAKPRLLVGCCGYSFANYLKSGKMTMEDFVHKGVELGVHGLDITTYWLKSTDSAYLYSFRNFAYKNGMSFSGAAIGTNMCQADASKRAEELTKIKQWVDRTEVLGASHLRVFGGEIPAGATDQQGVGWVVE